ncbi:transcriptional regulator [Rudaea sp.]|uniref:transcriptional regulator n=1 Tax=Rudaea sp. TaxID=2136325 RepID=UPI002ED4D2C5
MRTLPIYAFDEFTLDPAVRELRHRGATVSLPPKVFDCLVYLIEQRERAVGRDELIAAVWGRVDVSDAVLAQTLLRARRAVGDTGGEQTAIRTVPRFGYRWVAPLTVTMPTTTEDSAAATPTAVASEDAADLPAVASVLAANDAAPAMTSASPAPRRRWPLVAGALAIVAALLLWWTMTRPGHAPPAAQASAQSVLAIVLPMTMTADSAEHAWVRLGVMDYIASRMRADGGLNVLPSSQVLPLAGERSGDGDADALARRLLATTGAHWVIQPSAVPGHNDWSVRLHLLQIGAQPGTDVEARGDTVLTAAAAATDTLLRRLGHLRSTSASAPTALAERLQQIDAELLAGQLANARGLIQGVGEDLRNEPPLRLREGQLEFRAGNLDVATRVFDNLIARGSAVPDDIRAQALAGLGAAAIRSGDFANAERRYSDALALLEGNGKLDPVLLGNAYNGRGVARVELGRDAEAIADIGRARLAMQRAGNELEVAAVDVNLGMLESRRHNDAQALQQFDRAVATFARFDVRDNLAAALQAKAASQMRLAQPAAALASVQRAAEHFDAIENPILAERVALVHAEVSMANGRLGETEAWIARLQAGPRKPPQVLDTLRLRLHLVRGDTRGAAELARTLAAASGNIDGERILLGVQAALRADDVAAAQAWLARAGAEAQTDMSWLLAKALLAMRDSPTASESAFVAADAAAAKDSPDARVTAGCAHAAALIAQGAAERAAPLLGEIGTLADNDYRIARTTLALYRALEDRNAAADSEAAVKRLAGERDPRLPLVY